MAVFFLLIGDTMFETFADESDLPYSLEEQLSSHSNYDYNNNNVYNLTTGNSSTIAITDSNIETTTTTTTTTLSLTSEWIEKTPWIIFDAILFALAAAVTQACIVKHVLWNEYAGFRSPRNSTCTHTTEHSTINNNNGSNDKENNHHNNNTYKRQSAFQCLRSILWNWHGMQVLLSVTGMVIVPTLVTLLGAALATVRCIDVYPSGTVVMDFLRRLFILCVVSVAVGCLVWWLLPPILLMIPIIVAEHPDRVRDAIYRAYEMVKGYRKTMLQAMGPVIMTCSAVATILSMGMVRSMEALATVLAHRRGVYLRTDDEEWVFVLLTAICTLLFGPAVVVVPVMSM
eukprot:scaffold8828_cov204-Amphora_coffeaeformis.AAC.26